MFKNKITFFLISITLYWFSISMVYALCPELTAQELQRVQMTELEQHRLEKVYGEWKILRVEKYRGSLIEQKDSEQRIGQIIFINKDGCLSYFKRQNRPVLFEVHTIPPVMEGVIPSHLDRMTGLVDTKNKQLKLLVRNRNADLIYTEFEIVNDDEMILLSLGWAYHIQKIYDADLINTNATGCISGNCIDGKGTYVYGDMGKYIAEWPTGGFHIRKTENLSEGSKYTGEFKDGSRHGKGMQSWSDGTRYTGDYRNGKLNGQGTQSWPDYEKYSGGFKDGKRFGHGKYIWFDGNNYTGDFVDDLRHGQGTYLHYGDEYVGQWKNDLKHGVGTYTSSSRGEYSGEWEIDKKHGFGTFTWPDGSSYVGQWNYDDRSGQGTYTHANRSQYIGMFKEDKFDGQGTYTWTSGSSYTGQWKQGEFDGQGTDTVAGESRYVGQFKNGKKYGQGVLTMKSGDKYTGEWKDNKYNGQGTYSWANGNIFVGEYKDDKKHGPGKLSFANGRVVEGRWENGARVETYADSQPQATQITQTTAAASHQGAGRRIALVIGNSQYQHTPLLPNPENDARAIARELTKLGFDTEMVLDVTKATFDSALRRFGDRSENVAASLFFYAGHALEVDGINYLMPVDAKLEKKRNLKRETVALNDILDDMEGASEIRLLFLDACRNNPLSGSLARGLGNSRSAIGRGLARVETSTGTLISYATKTGATADDGDGTHSPYTQALLDHMGTRNLDVELMLRRVRSSVIESTNNKQTPWDSSSLLGEFYLFSPETGNNKSPQ